MTIEEKWKAQKKIRYRCKGHKKTGVKVDTPLHRLFVVNKDNKIKTIIEYSNSSVGDEINQSFDDRENGTIYNHHEYINNVRNMVMAFENKDYIKFIHTGSLLLAFRESPVVPE